MRVLDVARFLALGLLFCNPMVCKAERSRAKTVGTISDARIIESSGIAASRRFPDFLWTHNDSGDSPRVFLLNARGETVLVVNLKGANAVDWEDLAVARNGENAQVYVGDIGDNARKRNEIVVYRFAESAISKNAISSTRIDAAAPQIEIAPQKMTLRYPDGARDCETLMATRDGFLILVSKDSNGSTIYKTTRAFAPDTTQTLAIVGRFRFGTEGVFTRLATGGDLSADEKRVVVRTYSSAYEWKLPQTKNATSANAWRDVWKQTPRVVDLPAQQQGEAICWALNGRSWLLSGEGANSSLWQVNSQQLQSSTR